MLVKWLEILLKKALKKLDKELNKLVNKLPDELEEDDASGTVLQHQVSQKHQMKQIVSRNTEFLFGPKVTSR